jgi:ribosomal protein S18 acetylase RimI-like enzyme
MIQCKIREMTSYEIKPCCSLVRENWGDEAADRAWGQMREYLKGGPYAPMFYVADISPYDDRVKIGGFAAFCPSMLMKGAYDLIWITIDKEYQGRRIGKMLTAYRLNEIEKRGGSLVSLMTQKPDYFKKFGFEVAREMDSWHLMTLQLQPMRI